MKRIYQAALLAALGLTAPLAVHAQTSDVLLGFNDAAGPTGPTSAQNDYVIDLGSASSLVSSALAMPSYTVDLTSQFSSSLWNTAFGSDTSAGNNVAVGAVEGFGGGYPKSLYLTADGISSLYYVKFNNAVAGASSPSIGEYASSSHSGWSWYVGVDPNNPGNNTGVQNVSSQAANPLQYLVNGQLTETLYESIYSSGNYSAPGVEIGTFNFNLTDPTAQSGVVTFTAVPEPSTFALGAIAGLLALTFRRRLAAKTKTV